MPRQFRSHDETEAMDAEMRSGLKPFMIPHRTEHDETELLRDLPSTAADFIPKGQYDVAFVSLRHVIFKLDRKSATPIAHIIHKDCVGDKRRGGGGGGGGVSEVCDLIGNLCPPWTLRNKNGGLQAWLKRSEEEKLAWAPYAKLCKKIEAARKKHGIHLRDASMRDIEIMYSSHEATIEMFKIDQSRINNTGGKVYHLWPLDKARRKLRMSALITAETLDQLYPAERLMSGCVKISTNTYPAPAYIPPTPEHRGMMFPYLRPKGELPDLDEPEADHYQELTDSEIAELNGERSVTSSAQATTDTGKPPWRIWASSQRPGLAPPSWSPNSVPFSKHADSNNSQWYVDDMVTRENLIEEWDTATWKETKDGQGNTIFVRRTSEKPPEESVAGVDYPLVPELSSTYGANRDPNWHEEHIRKKELKNDMQALPEVEAGYKDQLRKTKRYQDLVSMNLEQSKDQRNRHDPEYQVFVRNMMMNQHLLDKELENSKSNLMQLRKRIGMFPTGVVKGLDGDESESPQSPSTPVEEVSQEPPAQEPTQKQEQTTKMRVTFAEPEKVTRAQQQVGISNQAETEALTERAQVTQAQQRQRHVSNRVKWDAPTEPFPEYKDPIVEKQAAERAKEKELIEKLKEEHRARKAEGRSIGDILTHTGVRRHEQVFFLNSADTDEVAVESSPATPVTPREWLCMARTVVESEGLEVKVLQSDEVSGGNRVKVEEGSEEAILPFSLPAIVEEDEVGTESAA